MEAPVAVWVEFALVFNPKPWAAAALRHLKCQEVPVWESQDLGNRCVFGISPAVHSVGVMDAISARAELVVNRERGSRAPRVGQALHLCTAAGL